MGDLHELAVRPGRIVLPEDRAPRNEKVGARLARSARCTAVYPTVDLEASARRETLTESSEALERVRHECLPGVAGMDGHAEHEVDALRGTDCLVDCGLGIERDPHTEPERASGRDRPGRLVD